MSLLQSVINYIWFPQTSVSSHSKRIARKSVKKNQHQIEQIYQQEMFLINREIDLFNQFGLSLNLDGDLRNLSYMVLDEYCGFSIL